MAVDLSKVNEYEAAALKAHEEKSIKFNAINGAANPDFETLIEMPLDEVEKIYYGLHFLAGTLTAETDFPLKPVIPPTVINLDAKTFNNLVNPQAAAPTPVTSEPVVVAKALTAPAPVRPGVSAPQPIRPVAPVKVAPLTPPTQVQPTATRPVQPPTVRRPGQ